MRGLLEVLGGFFLVLIGLVGLLVLAIIVASIVIVPRFMKAIPEAMELDQEARNFVDTAIPAIAHAWDPRELTHRATYRLVEAVEPEELESFFSLCKQFGRLESYQPCKGGCKSSTEQLSKFFKAKGQTGRLIGKIILGDYTAEAGFEQAAATIRVQVVKQDDQWLINSLTIASVGDAVTTSFTLGSPTSLEALLAEDVRRRKLEALLQSDNSNL